MKSNTGCNVECNRFHNLFLRLFISLIAFFPSYIFSYELSESYQVVDSDSGVITSQEKHTVFGQNLFNGNFAKDQFSGFNPYYRIAVGDKLLVQMWGAVEADKEMTVDPQGNIFLPHVGPIHVLGVLNDKLNEVIRTAISRVYKKDVYIYVNLVSSQPVKVFVTGSVVNPGLYSGLSSESILAYLDRAGGIDPLRGSYLEIGLKRNKNIIEKFDLYDFLISGELPQRQLHEGDVIIVPSRQNVIAFSGLVENPYQIEFLEREVSLKDALKIVRPLPVATHLAIDRNQGLIKEVQYIDISQALEDKISLMSGDAVNFVSDKIQGTIGIQVQGEHLGQAQYVLPYGAKLGDLIPQIEFSDQSKATSIQLYRSSLAKQQQQAMLTTLQILQSQVLSARSDTFEEANLRSKEAELILKFVERAKLIKPKGQVILDESLDVENVTLENGDTIFIPKITQLVRVSGEVLFPSSVMYQDSLEPSQYIELVGGYAQDDKKSKIILKKSNGLSLTIKDKKGLVKKGSWAIEPGDELMVLPDVDVKSLQHAKDIFQIIYQLALSAGVVLKI